MENMAKKVNLKEARKHKRVSQGTPGVEKESSTRVA